MICESATCRAAPVKTEERHDRFRALIPCVLAGNAMHIVGFWIQNPRTASAEMPEEVSGRFRRVPKDPKDEGRQWDSGDY